MEAQDVQRLEDLLGYHFSRSELLTESLTHSSQAQDRLASNERMEFLGDAVLSVVICHALFERFPEYQEGELTKLKSAIVSRKSCSQVASQLALIDFIRVGKGTDSGRALTGSIAAGVLEAVIAAIYLDSGLDAARTFILSAFDAVIDQIIACEHQDNFKSVLQQYCQRHLNGTPAYELLDEKGPDHNKCFEVAAVIKHRRYASAWAVTKKDAEQRAARNALVELGILESLPDEEGV